MIETYKRLHRAEQESRVACGLEPSNLDPVIGLTVGCALSLAAWLVIFAVVLFIGAMTS